MGVAGGAGGGADFGAGLGAIVSGGDPHDMLRQRAADYRSFRDNSYDSFMGMNDADWARATEISKRPLIGGLYGMGTKIPDFISKLDPAAGAQLSSLLAPMRAQSPLGRAMEAYNKAAADRAKKPAAPAAPAAPTGTTPAAPAAPTAPSVWGPGGAASTGGGSMVPGMAGATASTSASANVGYGGAPSQTASSSTGMGSGFIDTTPRQDSLAGVFGDAVGMPTQGRQKSSGYTIF